MSYHGRVFYAVLATAAAGTVVAHHLFCKRKWGSQKHNKKVYALLIKVTFEKIEDRDTWIAGWTAVANHCAKNEPQTLSYEVAIAEDKPLQIVVIERYTNKAALTEVHQKSEPFLAFRNSVQGISAIKEGQAYTEIDVGYV